MTNLSLGFPTKRDLTFVASLDMILSKKRIKKVLISLHGCTGWSAPLLFAHPKDTQPSSPVRSESDCRSRGCELPARSQTFVQIDREIISTIILLPLIQERLLSVTSKSMCMKYWLTALASLPRKKCG